jgi:signal transduction histidine kinase
MALLERATRVVRPSASGHGLAWPPLDWMVKAAVVAVVYVAAAKFGLSLASGTRQVTAVFPSTGIALAVLVVWGWRLWPGVFVGALVANATSSEAVTTAVGIAIGNTAAALAGWYLLRRLLGFDEHLGRSRDGCALTAVAALTPVVSATNGVATLALHGVVSWSAFWEVWRVWWIGDSLGIVLVCPVLLTWRRRSRLPQPPANLAELVVMCGLCLTVGVVALSGVLFAPGSHYQLQYAVFPFVLWAALRSGQHVSASLVLGVSAIAVWGAVHGRGPFAAGSVDERLVLLDLFMAITAGSGLALSTATAERRHAEVRLHASEDNRKALLAAILQAEEDARQRVAVELHDDTIQVLTAALVDLDSCGRAITSHDRERARERIRRIRETLNDAVNRVRRLTFELRPPVLETQGVTAAVDQMLDGFSDDLGIAVDRRIHLDRYPPDIEILVFRTTRELLANVRKHAHATYLQVTLVERDSLICGSVIDDGCGFDVDAALDRTKTRYSLGLDATSERLRLHDGNLVLDSSPAGTTARFTIPPPPADQPARTGRLEADHAAFEPA